MTGKTDNRQIFILDNITEKLNEKGEGSYLTYIDIKAAFDSIGRSNIWKILE